MSSTRFAAQRTAHTHAISARLVRLVHNRGTGSLSLLSGGSRPVNRRSGFFDFQK